MIKIILISIFLSSYCYAQIANASFFPNMRSINPGVSHLRTNGFISLDASKTEIIQKQDVQTGGIQDGITTTVDLDKRTLFYASRGGGISVEALIDQEVGTRTEGFETSSYERKTTTEGESSVMQGIIDLGLVGILIAKANYSNFNDFHVDEVPNLNRITHDTDLEYTLTRIGTAIEVKGISIGAFYSMQTAKGQVDSILYNPTTGAKNDPEVNELEYETISYGAGIGYTTKTFHFEFSLEKISEQKLKQSNTYLLELDTPSTGQRLSGIAEARFGKLSLGIRLRQVKGNFADLEQLISSNMLYLNAEEQDTRLENSFNFSYGDSKGISLSGFYSTSNTETEEESQVLRNNIDYDTETQITSYGISINYVY